MAVQEENNSLHKKLKGIYMLGEKSWTDGGHGQKGDNFLQIFL